LEELLMNKRRVTSEDVARSIGVSRTTVSLVLNNVQGIQISSETRQRVLEAAATLGYVPNAMAQALVSRRAKVIGLVFTHHQHHIATDAFLPQVLDGILEIVRANNLRLLIDIVEPQHQRQAYLQLVRAKHIDGIVLSGPLLDDEALETLDKEGFPTVLMGQLPKTDICSVDIDNRGAACQAVEYLLGQNHRQIACITNAPLSYSAASDRLAGYRDALEHAGIVYEESIVRFGDFDPESGYIQMGSLLSSGKRFTAAFVASDTVLIGAKAAIRERGLHVPDDISLVGFDDIAWSRYADPAITTVHLPAEAIGNQACTMLMQILNGQSISEKNLVLPTELIIRNSCRRL
jgi:DNA-binding LacI/PurR family transcriptional regulator